MGDWGAAMADRITLSGLCVDGIVGVLDFEQVTPQPIQLDLELVLPLSDSGDSGDLSSTVDYATVADEVAFLATHSRLRLIESLGLAICRNILASPQNGEARAAVEEVTVHIRKPTILGGRAVPGVTMTRVGPARDWEMLSEGVHGLRLVDTGRRSAWRIWSQGDHEVPAGSHKIIEGESPRTSLHAFSRRIIAAHGNRHSSISGLKAINTQSDGHTIKCG